MRISALISQLRAELGENGDLDLSYEVSDGRSTWLANISGVTIKRGYTPWKGHSQRKDVLIVNALY